jgi:hypothetical protein
MDLVRPCRAFGRVSVAASSARFSHRRVVLDFPSSVTRQACRRQHATWDTRLALEFFGELAELAASPDSCEPSYLLLRKPLPVVLFYGGGGGGLYRMGDIDK